MKANFQKLNTILEVQRLTPTHFSLINCPLVDRFETTCLSTGQEWSLLSFLSCC